MPGGMILARTEAMDRPEWLALRRRGIGDPGDERCARKAAYDEIVGHLEEVEELCRAA